MGNSTSNANFSDESQYKHEAPGPDYSRSPCPVFNTLSNHGYILRDGKNIRPEVLRHVLQVYLYFHFLVKDFLCRRKLD